MSSALNESASDLFHVLRRLSVGDRRNLSVLAETVTFLGAGIALPAPVAFSGDGFHVYVVIRFNMVRASRCREAASDRSPRGYRSRADYLGTLRRFVPISERMLRTTSTALFLRAAAKKRSRNDGYAQNYG